MKSIYIICLLLFGFGLSNAQSSTDYEPKLPDYSKGITPIENAPPPPPPNPVPIDGGVGFLLAAGVGYGIKRMRKRV